ncbi:carboxypeptidase regulatory-like domain-containing protein [Thermomonas sp.]
MSHPNRVRLSKLSLGLLVALAAAPVFAQSTSAGVGGQVMGADGQPVAGAEVTITHVDSGTVSRITTDASGRYSARGLRVGGPYTITVNKAGSGSDTEENIYLSLSQNNTVDAKLNNDVTTLGSVQAIASGGSTVFSANKMGAGTSIDRETIESLPSIGGNIQDFMRLDPRVAFVDRASGVISAGGQNPRFNAISIDGVSASDTFGLEGNNMPTRRQPVSMEAIEAIDISLSNFDVTIAGAAGANVNAVTKSGTNQFHGSLYGTYRDGDWFGKNPAGKPFAGFNNEETYGVTFGGPLIKDRLFFFANYEKFKQTAPGTDLSGTALGKANAVITSADVARAQSIASSKWGIDAGTLESNGNTDLEEYALKLDWNISDNHRASIRYSNLLQSKLRVQGMTSSSVSLSSYWYQHEKSVESYVAQVFSDWTENFSTEFKASHRDYSAVRVVKATAPSVRIFFGGTEAAPSGDSIYLGTELSTQGNTLITKTWNYYGAGTLTLGNHDVKFGAEYADNSIYNYFGQNSWGTYTFFGLDNFQAGKWSSYNLAKETSPGSIAVDYNNTNLGLFVQDSWYVNSNLTLTYGVRGDRAGVNRNPAYNAAASAYFGYDNSKVLDGKFLIQPRFGFNYTFNSDHQMQLRGGIGLFQGDAPQVWVGNSYNTTGFNYASYSYNAYNPSLPFSPDAFNQPVPTGPGAGGAQQVNFVGNDFKLPSIWKANLGFETETGLWGTVFSVEALLSKVNNGLFYQSLNIGPTPTPGAGPMPSYLGPDGREIYYNPGKTGKLWASGDARFGRNPAYNNVFLIQNTRKGESQQLTASLAKPWTNDSDWSWNFGYTYTHATEVGPLTSSTASSGWGYQYAFDVNRDIETTARYQIKDRFAGSLNWKHEFFAGYETRLGLVYEGRSGRAFSYVYVNDANGDSRSANDLFYVPKGPGDVLFGNLTAAGVFTPDAAMEKSFFDWLAGNKDLAPLAGKVAPTNGFRADWVNTFDLRLSQELPGFFKGHKSEFWVDVQNVGNLLNKKWGNIYDYGFLADARVATLQGIYNGKYVYNYRFADAPTIANGDADGFDAGISQWSVQVGFKYKF